jgi:hypothetical protein
MKKFYGLRGTKLNIAIAVVAGTDFALFGYGKTYLIMPETSSAHANLMYRSGCHGWPFDARIVSSLLS